MRFANPHALWLLLAVPAAVIAYGARRSRVRRRRLARLGDEALDRAHDRRRLGAAARSCARR